MTNTGIRGAGIGHDELCAEYARKDGVTLAEHKAWEADGILPEYTGIAHCDAEGCNLRATHRVINPSGLYCLGHTRDIVGTGKFGAVSRLTLEPTPAPTPPVSEYAPFTAGWLLGRKAARQRRQRGS